jgi:iron-sulfur cluster assembly protein
MLALTTHAAEAINGLLASSELPEGSGLCISMSTDSEQGLALELSLADGPKESEQVVQDQGANVFLEPELASYLEDKLLDAEVAENQVNFTLNEQDEDEQVEPE